MQPTTKRIERLLVGDSEHLRAYLRAHHPADIAAAITRMRPETIIQTLEAIGNTRSVETFSELEMDTQRACFEFADPERVIHFFEALSPDDQADLFKSLAPEIKDRLLALLNKSEREDLMQLARYEEGTAGAAMTTDFFALPAHFTVAEALEKIRCCSREAETIYIIYILENDVLQGVVSLKDMVLAPPEQTLRQRMNPNVITVTADEDVEDVAKKIAKYNLLALPVVSARKELRGIITVDDVIDIIEEETTEDIYAMAAVGAPVDYLGAGILKIWRQRAPWLLLLVFSGFIAGFVIEFFRDALSRYMELIFFIPLLMGSGGNAGTQASTVIVRGLATGELSPALFLRVLWIEMRVGLLVGGTMGALAAFRAYFQPTQSGLHLNIAFIVGGTMFLVVTVAKSIGAMLPLLFKRMGLDPALMSNPLIQSIMDILTLSLYFGLAKLLLPL